MCTINKILSKSFKIIILIICMMNLSFGYILHPEDESLLNYKEVLIQWDQEKNTEQYNIQIIDISNNNIIVDVIDSTLLTIVNHDIDWNGNYLIRLRKDIGDNLYSDWLDSNYFMVNDLPDYFPLNDQIEGF